MRTPIMLPRELESRLRIEARRRGVSIAELVREAVERYPPASAAGQPLSFFALGDGGPPDASEHVDDYVADASRANA